MKPVYRTGEVIEGDCLEVLAGLHAECVDAIVTDPPYGLGFMGKGWDHGVPGVPFWQMMWGVAKPSAYLLAFGGTRTVHRMATAIEDAGWIIRDMLVWAYASGFPKSKASLKPAWEPIVMARKPGPLRMLAIDECRIPFRDAADAADAAVGFGESMAAGRTIEPVNFPTNYDKPEYIPGVGRWPANVVLTDPIFDGDALGVVGGGETASGDPAGAMRNDLGWFGEGSQPVPLSDYGDSGTYSRFFLIPKADRTDREPVLRTDREPVLRTDRGIGALRDGSRETLPRRNSHPTVKPIELMRHLVRLVTPQSGTVLDPFLGSGTTAIACELEGFPWIGIEKEAEYVAIAEARLNGTQRGMGLVG